MRRFTSSTSTFQGSKIHFQAEIGFTMFLDSRVAKKNPLQSSNQQRHSIKMAHRLAIHSLLLLNSHLPPRRIVDM